MEQKNQVVPFVFNGKEVRTALDNDGGIWIVAADICESLGLQSHKGSYSHHLSKLDDDEKRQVDRGVFDGTPMPDLGVAAEGLKRFFNATVVDVSRSIWLVNEPGAYLLTMRSDKPLAKKFKKWLAHEVIPTIRKTGGYRIPKPATIVPIDREFRAALRMAKAAGLVKNQAVLSASALTRKLTGADPLVLLDATHLIADVQERHYTATGLGELLGGKGAREVNELLHNRGLQVPVRIGKQKLWKPTAKGRRFAVLVDTGKRHHGGSMIQQVRWLESVVSEIGGRA
jgi:prophage antirepressor-like protein